MTQQHALGGFDNRDVYSHSSGGQKSETKVLAALVPAKASAPGLWLAVFPLCLHLAFPLPCLCTISPPNEDISHIGLGATLMTSL